MIRIVIFASGLGTNAENITTYFDNSQDVKIVSILSNNAKAGVLKRAQRLGIPTKIFSRKYLFSDEFLNYLKKEADFIILAGFLLKIPEKIIKSFKKKIINIHPSLLPKYGGKGMFGIHVHNAVVTNKEKESGITIHYVNENYDEGAIIFQKKVTLDKDDTPQDVAEKIHKLEQKNFPQVIEKIITKN